MWDIVSSRLDGSNPVVEATAWSWNEAKRLFKSRVDAESFCIQNHGLLYYGILYLTDGHTGAVLASVHSSDC